MERDLNKLLLNLENLIYSKYAYLIQFYLDDIYEKNTHNKKLGFKLNDKNTLQKKIDLKSVIQIKDSIMNMTNCLYLTVLSCSETPDMVKLYVKKRMMDVFTQLFKISIKYKTSLIEVISKVSIIY